MTDETSKELLLAVATWIASDDNEEMAKAEFAIKHLLARAEHERDYPEDRG